MSLYRSLHSHGAVRRAVVHHRHRPDHTQTMRALSGVGTLIVGAALSGIIALLLVPGLAEWLLS